MVYIRGEAKAQGDSAVRCEGPSLFQAFFSGPLYQEKKEQKRPVYLKDMAEQEKKMFE